MLKAQESIQFLFEDYGINIEQAEAKSSKKSLDYHFCLDITDEQETVLYTVLLSTKLKSAQWITKTLIDADNISPEETDATLREVLNIYGGHIIPDLPHKGREYLVLSAPYLPGKSQADPHENLILYEYFYEIIDKNNNDNHLISFTIIHQDETSLPVQKSEKFLFNKNILILEDAKISSKFLKDIIENLGGIAHIFSKIEEEKEILKNNYDAAIVDLILKGGSSFNLIKKLKIKDPGLRLIVISAMPDLLAKNPEVLSFIDFIFAKPIDKDLLSRNLMEMVQPPVHERRISIRKKPMLNLWVAKKFPNIKKTDLFESPHAIEISKDGFSFHSYFTYEEKDDIVIWIYDKVHTEILELWGNIAWKKVSEETSKKSLTLYSYGIKINKETSPNIKEYLETIITLPDK
ncbi:MAG: response regulator [Spirochaetia bacterium]|nr:response regulator [Spirochaetia bacterium]